MGKEASRGLELQRFQNNWVNYLTQNFDGGKFGMFKKVKYLLVISMLLIVPLLFAACGSDSSSTAASQDSQDVAPTTLKLGDSQFESLWINNALLKYVVEAAYGHTVTPVTMTTPVMQESLANGEIDIMLEGWQQNIIDWYNEEIEAGRIENRGMIYEGGPQFFAIPQWVHDEYGITTVDDMKQHVSLFPHPEGGSKGAFYNCVIGWQCEQINTVKMEAYGLTEMYEIISPGSSAALDAALAGPQKRNEPVFGYYWAPTALMGMFDWYILEEPVYNDDCWAKVTAAREDESLRPIDEACAYQTLPVDVLANTGLEAKAPLVHELLGKFMVGLEGINRTAAWFNENEKTDYKDAAVYYLRTFTDNAKTWMPADRWAKVQAVLDAEDEL